METLSHTFIESLLPPRDALYQSALARTGAPAAAEVALQTSARIAFREFTADHSLDVSAAMHKNLGAFILAPATPAPPAQASMPADVWARLAAAVQIEAAASSHSQALNPDSVLLRPDPMLAPKKKKPRHEEDFDISSPARLFTLIGAALFVGLLITVYILTRPPSATRGTLPSPTSHAGTP